MPRMSRTTTRVASAVAVAALGLAGAAGCSSDKKSNAPADANANAKVTLSIGLFGTFGFKEAGLYDAYTKAHPNITIKEDTVEQSGDYWTRLKTRLASGSGLADIQGIEIGFVSDVVQNHANQFVDFAALPEGNQLKSSFYDWKWQQATAEGKTLGLGTDAGPEAICYRSDLLKKAGLASDGAA
ncbi:MAG: cellobiose transport system substrate-binding protein, partial [Pseudonocardiales bacterium]|nr:cellobiose transport system substrate-binding protein [Pseudonocardiales bacterium]